MLNRNDILKKIDRIEVKHCDGCEIQISLGKKHGFNSPRMQRACLSECPIGKEIQTLGAQLTVNPRKSLGPVRPI